MTDGEQLERDYTLSRKAGWFARAGSAPRVAPERYTRAPLDALGGVERRRYDDQRAVWHANLGPIITPQMQTLFDELEEIVQTNRQDGDRVRGSAVLSALPGLGKTTAAVCYGVRYHREQIELHGASTPEGHDRVPVVYLALTSSTTMRSLNSALCRFFDHPGWSRGNAALLADRAIDRVLSCQTRLIIIDDVHFLDMNRRDGREVANHFKWLQSQFPVTFLIRRRRDPRAADAHRGPRPRRRRADGREVLTARAMRDATTAAVASAPTITAISAGRRRSAISGRPGCLSGSSVPRRRNRPAACHRAQDHRRGPPAALSATAEHIKMLGHFPFTLPHDLAAGARRQLRELGQAA